MQVKPDEGSAGHPFPSNADAIPKLPAWRYLGAAVSLIVPQSPFNVNEVFGSTENLHIVNPEWGSEEVSIPGIDTQYRIPNNFTLEIIGSNTKYHDLVVETGESLAKKASEDSSVRTAHFGINTLDYEYGSTLNGKGLYGLFSLEQTSYVVSLNPQIETWKNLNTSFVLAVQELPGWSEDKDVQARWKEFFETWGTHIVLAVVYGNKYQLRVTSPDPPPLNNERWKACIQANYSEIIKPTEPPANREELDLYDQSKDDVCYVFGGDRAKAMTLAADHENRQKLDDWTNSLTAPNDSIINAKLKSIYRLLRESPLPGHQDLAKKVQDPLDFFLQHSGGGDDGGDPATECTITVTNTRGNDTNYAVFLAPPNMDNKVKTTDDQAWMNAWYTKPLGVNEDFTVTYDAKVFAWAGTAPRELTPGLVVSGGFGLEIQLGTNDVPGSTVEMEIKTGTPTLKDRPPREAPTDAFELITKSDFNQSGEQYLVGIAKLDKYGVPSPVTSITARNNTKYILFPKLKFYIIERLFEFGEIADFSVVSNEGAEVDFTDGDGKGKNHASVTQTPNGGWKIEYSKKDP